MINHNDGLDRNSMMFTEQQAEIARLTLALSTARNDALDEAVTECEKQRLAAMNEDCKRESLGASWCREAIANLMDAP